MTGNPEDDVPGQSWWAQLRRGIGDVAELVAEIVRRTQPEPVLYLRCDSCGQVAPRTAVRHYGQLDTSTYLVEVPHRLPESRYPADVLGFGLWWQLAGLRGTRFT